MELYRHAISVGKDPENSRWLSPLLLTADSALCALIIWKVPCMSAANPVRREFINGQRVMQIKANSDFLRYRDRLESVHAASPSVPRR